MRYDAIVFDLGNTLVPWGAAETEGLTAALADTFAVRFGPDPGFTPRALAVRDRLIAEREATTMRELTVAEWAAAVAGAEADDALVDGLTKTLHRRFVELARIPDHVPGVLARLAETRPLAVLSNFVLAEPIHELLDDTGLARHFAHVEVSARSGFCKPHPEPFEIVREKLGVPMERVLMVGDDFWADIVGGHRAGFLTALTHEHRQGPTSDPRAPEVAADRVLTDVRELLDD